MKRLLMVLGLLVTLGGVVLAQEKPLSPCDRTALGVMLLAQGRDDGTPKSKMRQMAIEESEDDPRMRKLFLDAVDVIYKTDDDPIVIGAEFRRRCLTAFRKGLEKR